MPNPVAVVRDLVAVVIVSAVPAGLVLAGYGTWRWARWMLRAGWLGLAGLALTAVAVGNLGVARTCDEQAGIRNRPAVAAVIESGACRRSALAQIDLAGLTGLAATLVTFRPAGRLALRR